MKRIHSLLLLIQLLFSGMGYSQVMNDNIEHRLDLVLDAAPSFSSTAGCTIERSCISEALEANCVKFHNDQWFQFRTAAAGTYYLNVRGQSCRDILGVQLLVLDGIPCQTETYRVISCVSLATQDDIYLQLDELQAEHTYLLNLDGYLHDFCSFSIQFSTVPNGLPALSEPENNRLNSYTYQNIVELEWSVSESQAQDILSYKILRRHESENRFSPIRTLQHARDSYGHAVLTYSSTDTLQKMGIVHYKLMAEQQDHTLVQLGEVQHELKPSSKALQNKYVLLNLNYKSGTPLSIYVMQAKDKQVIKKTEIVFTKQHRQLKIDTEQFRKRGITRIEVKTTDHKRQKSQSQFFEIQ